MIASADDTAIDLREGGGMSLTVEPSNLTKAYGGRIVVDGLGLRIPEGSVYGFLGPNGAGKSTTMKMLLSLIRPTGGEVEVLGQPMTRSTRRQLPGGVGSPIETPPGYAHLTGAENMRIVQLGFAYWEGLQWPLTGGNGPGEQMFLGVGTWWSSASTFSCPVH